MHRHTLTCDLPVLEDIKQSITSENRGAAHQNAVQTSITYQISLLCKTKFTQSPIVLAATLSLVLGAPVVQEGGAIVAKRYEYKDADAMAKRYEYRDVETPVKRYEYNDTEYPGNEYKDTENPAKRYEYKDTENQAIRYEYKDTGSSAKRYNDTESPSKRYEYKDTESPAKRYEYFIAPQQSGVENVKRYEYKNSAPAPEQGPGHS